MTPEQEQIIQSWLESEDTPELHQFLAMLPENLSNELDLEAFRFGWEAHRLLHLDSDQAGVELDLYQGTDDDSALFHFGQSGQRQVVVLGLNPCTAEQAKSDRTLCKIRRTTELNGYDGFIMTHLYALRSPAADRLPLNEDPALMDENINAISELIENGATALWAAWGKNICLRPYLGQALARIRAQAGNVDWLHFGPLTMEGHPRHPSRLRYGWNFSEFDIDDYLAKHFA